MLGPLIAAGASLAGNLISANNQQDINQQNFWAQNLANQQSIGLARENRDRAEWFSRENRELARSDAAAANAAMLADKDKDRALQQEFAQMGIKWRVEDAERAGVHPLFALGGGGASYAPSAISIGTAPPGASVAGGSPSIGASRAVASNSFANMGQDVSRAVLAAEKTSVKNEAFETAYQDAQLRNMSLRNELLASQIGRNTQAGGPQKSVIKENEWPGAYEVKQAESTPLPEGYIMKGRSDAQVAENRWDELGANMWGLKNLVEDAAMNPGAALRWWQWVNSQMIAEQYASWGKRFYEEYRQSPHLHLKRGGYGDARDPGRDNYLQWKGHF